MSRPIEIIRRIAKARAQIGEIHNWRQGPMRKIATGQWQPVEQRRGRPGREIKLSRERLDDLLHQGNYSIISAGRNPASPKEAALAETDPFFAARHDALRRDIEALGLNYTEVEGHYGGKETSFIVFHRKDPGGDKALLVHHTGDPTEYGEIRELGKKYNQDSVIHSRHGDHEMHYTTGPHAGHFLKGKGFEYKPLAEDYYSKVDLRSGDVSKFSLVFDWDHEHPADHALLKGVITPYVGPRGGLWANAEHTVHWDGAGQWSGRVSKPPPHTAQSAPAHPFAGAERAITGRAVECFVALWGEGDGRRMIRRIGDNESVPVTVDEVRRMRKAGNAEFTHNHPRNNFFSPDDLSLAHQASMAEMRVVVTDGVWSIKRPDEGWDKLYGLLQKAWDVSLDAVTERVGQHPSDDEWLRAVMEADRVIAHGFAAGGHATFSQWT